MVSYCGNFFTTPSPGRVSIPDFCLSLLLLYFVLLPFEENGLPFWVPGVLCQHCFVEVAQHSNELLMNLWGRKWFPVLFLHHLETNPQAHVFFMGQQIGVCVVKYNKNRKLKTLKFKLPCYRICNINLIILKFFSILIESSGVVKADCFLCQHIWLSLSWLGPRVCISNKFQVMLINLVGPETALGEPTIWEVNSRFLAWAPR